MRESVVVEETRTAPLWRGPGGVQSEFPGSLCVCTETEVKAKVPLFFLWTSSLSCGNTSFRLLTSHMMSFQHLSRWSAWARAATSLGFSGTQSPPAGTETVQHFKRHDKFIVTPAGQPEAWGCYQSWWSWAAQTLVLCERMSGGLSQRGKASEREGKGGHPDVGLLASCLEQVWENDCIIAIALQLHSQQPRMGAVASC